MHCKIFLYKKPISNPFYPLILLKTLFLAYFSDLPVGYLWAQIQELPETPFTYSRKKIYIHHVSVDERHRRKGIGITLINEAKKLSTEMDIKDITFTTWVFNKEANDFFQSQGFEIDNIHSWKFST